MFALRVYERHHILSIPRINTQDANAFKINACNSCRGPVIGDGWSPVPVCIFCTMEDLLSLSLIPLVFFRVTGFWLRVSLWMEQDYSEASSISDWNIWLTCSLTRWTLSYFFDVSKKSGRDANSLDGQKVRFSTRKTILVELTQKSSRWLRERMDSLLFAITSP